VVASLVVCAALFAAASPERPRPRTPAPLALRPLAYFEQACASCHGEGGSWFAPNAKERLSAAQLVAKVRDMARDHAARPIAGRDLEAQVAHMRAIMRNEPFLALVGATAREARFEVSPGAQVTARAGGRSRAVRPGGGLWIVDVRGIPLHSVRVTATRAGRSATLDLAVSDWSHPR
jgi:hypothetical protein